MIRSFTMELKVLLLLWFLGIQMCNGKYYKVEYHTLPVDHFSYANKNTFKLRYLINDTHWTPGNPIFFYTGNEGDITLFAENTGFIWDIAPQFSAMVVFAEHRFYGETMPFGNKSYTDPQYLGYLTSTQALADYVYLLDNIKTKRKAIKKGSNSPVIAFGGSYGGMLAAWIRLKYPSTVYAALASSAPIFQFQDLTPCGSYYNIVASVFKLSPADGACAKNIKKSWSEIKNKTSTKEGRDWLSKEWKLCKPLTSENDLGNITDYLKGVYGNLAMVNYPYPTNFLANLPAYPVQATCKHLENSNLKGNDLLVALKNAISVYTNYTGTSKCLDILSAYSGGFGYGGWDFQSCTELVMPMCIENNDMFENEPWNLEAYKEGCKEKFGVTFEKDNTAVLEYGGITAPYTNIIFTNGLMDPWSAGGMLQSNLSSVYTILIPNGAHHFDLRASNPADPPFVRHARDYIKNILRAWLKLYEP